MIDFPSTPTVGDLFYAPSSGITYRWDGTLWLSYPGTGPGYGPTGDFFATMGWPATNVGATFTTVTPPVVSGNAGGWYNATTGRYTPPPGRYHLHADVSGNSSTASLGNLGVRIVKNSVNVQDNYGMTGYGYYTAPGVDVVLDANGTDWFEAQFNCIPTSTTMESITFLAYPIAGAKGPPGDQGPPPTAGGGLVRDVLLTGPASQIDVSNLTVKSCMILFKLGVVSGTGQAVYFQHTVNGVPDATSGYYQLQMYQTGATLGGGQSAVSTQQVITSVDVNYWLTGQMVIPEIKANLWQKTCQFNMVSAGVWYNQAVGFFGAGLNANVNGYRFYAGVNLCAGSFVRVIGWP